MGLAELSVNSAFAVTVHPSMGWSSGNATKPHIGVQHREPIGSLFVVGMPNDVGGDRANTSNRPKYTARSAEVEGRYENRNNTPSN